MNRPDILLFDLGGVIVPWVGTQAMSDLSNREPGELMASLAAEPIFAAHETGQCDDLTFARFMIHFLGIDHTPDSFIPLWNSWVLAPYSGTENALRTLQQSYTLGCLSNTNAPHWEHLKALIDLDDYLDYSFASHLINVSKPDPKSFRIALESMNAKPETVWYFDDTEINVTAAKNAGMTAFHVDRAVGVIPMLKSLELI